MNLNEILILISNTLSFSLGYALIAYYIGAKIMNGSIKFYRLFALLSSVYLFVSIVFIFAGIPCITLALFLYLLFNKMPIMKNIICCVMSIILIILVMVCMNLLGNALGMTSAQMIQKRNMLSYNIYSSVVCIVFSIIAVCLLHIVNKKVISKTSILNKMDNYQLNKTGYLVLLNLIFIVVIICTTEYASVRADSEIAEYITIFGNILACISISFSIISVILTVKLMQHEAEENEISKNKEITELYKKEIQGMYDEVREFKHDYMKIYSSMSMLLKNNDIKKAREFFENEIEPLQDNILSEISDTHTVMLLEDSIIQGVLYSYVMKAHKMKINFVTDIQSKIPQSSTITSLELSRVLGILLDNAFEEAVCTKDKYVQLGALYDQQTIYAVKNDCKNLPDMGILFQKNYSAKGPKRGRGLSIAKSICDKYENVLFNIHIEDEQFIAEVVIE